MNEPKDQATGTPRACHCSTVSLIDFQMTVANLSVAEHALREQPYERLPYLAGMLQVAQCQMESLRQEAMECKRTAMDARSELLKIAAACARFQHNYVAELEQDDLKQFGHYAHDLKKIADRMNP
jgi:Mg2+ and Co2+ transporter CorA